MQIIGITGGVACGKSMVTQQLASLGAGVLDADRAGHEVLRLPHVEAAARKRWGDAIFGPDGHIDRARLARIVFAAGPEAKRERNYLEQLTRPKPSRCRASKQPFWMLPCCWKPVGTKCATGAYILNRLPRCGWPGPWPEVGLKRILPPVRAPRNRWIVNEQLPM
jgi:hypothetical protein